MFTVPLTPIEGAIAMPRLRPLDRLPAPFGRDWALLPPGRSWRTGLKAHYAAVLRTFCMTDKAIFSFGGWVPLDAQRTTVAAAAATATAARPAVFPHARAEAPPVFAEAGAAQSIEAPVFASVSSGAAPYWKALAGSVCAFGGVAMLTWIALDHPTHRHSGDAGQPVDAAIARRDAQPEQRRAPDGTTTRGAARGAAREAWIRSTASARTESTSLSAPTGYASASSTTKAPPAQRAASRGDQVSHVRKLRETADSQREKTHRRPARSTTAHPLSLVAPIADDMPRMIVPPISQPTSPTPSIAGSYSPLAPTRLGMDDYANVTMSAATRLRGIAPLPRPTTPNHASVSGGTEWMNHLSQRRVTEVPDQFAN